MSQKEKEWFLDERARALAVMHLTRRDDLKVAGPGTASDLGLAFLVRIVKEASRPSLRQFGVALDASISAATEAEVNERLRPVVARYRHLGDCPYPICLFHFTMADNAGYYTWIAEPIVAPPGKPQLHTRQQPDCKKLDRKALDTIVDRVDAWYDAFYATIQVEASA
jgi:hypothetical protein